MHNSTHGGDKIHRPQVIFPISKNFGHSVEENNTSLNMYLKNCIVLEKYMQFFTFWEEGVQNLKVIIMIVAFF